MAKKKAETKKTAAGKARKTASKNSAKKTTSALRKTSIKKVKKVVKKKAPAGKKLASKATPKRAAKKTTSKSKGKARPPHKTALPGKRGEPKTMEELLAQTGYVLRGVKRGEVVEGTITDIAKKMVLVDIGSKTEGLVVDKEYEAAKEFIAELSVGDTVQMYVLTPENERGQILLSLKKAATDRTWEKFEEAAKTGEVMTVRGLEVNKGGVIVRADSVQGFIPSSQFGKIWLGQMDELVNRLIKVRVIEVDREKNRLIFSEKQVSEAKELEQRAEALKQISVGEAYKGVVSGIMPFGVFVTVDVPLEQEKKTKKTTRKKTEKSANIGKVEGLVHISEISWEKVDDPSDYFKVGDEVEVKVLGIDEASGKLNLSVKRMTSDPWEQIVKKYPTGTKVKGKVSRVAPFGAFVTLQPGIEGLLHISKIPAGEEPEAGKTVEVFVEQVDMEHRRMSLGMVLKEVPVGYK